MTISPLAAGVVLTLSREELPMEENPASLTHTMIQLFRQGKDPQ